MVQLQRRQKTIIYSDYTLQEVSSVFSLTIAQRPLLTAIEPVEPPAWLSEWLERTMPFALGSEKARSEFLVAPILTAWVEQSSMPLAIYSGQRLDVDAEKGLTGECDFILSKTPPLPFLQTPIITIVEAKKHDIEAGFGQCAAQMVGARLFNERAQTPVKHIAGCVTNGENWHFMLLTDTLLVIDRQQYYLDNLARLLGALNGITAPYQNTP